MRLVALFCLIAPTLAVGLARAAGAPPPAPAAESTHAGDERFRLSLELARVFDRFQSAEAESLGHSTSSAGAYGVRYDFRVLDIPAGKPTARPALHVDGAVLASERTLGAMRPGDTVEHAPILEIDTGVGLHVPLELLPGNSGVAFRLGYEGGYVLSRNGNGDFLTLSSVGFGFERTDGAFEGSALTVGYGRNETYGIAAAAKRWNARFLLQGAIGPAHADVPDAQRLRGFLRLDVDTDGKDGPDGLAFQMGLALDAGTLFRNATGVFGL